MAISINFQIEDLKRNQFSFTDIEALKDFAKNESQFWQEQWGLVSAIGNRNQHTTIAAGSVWREMFNTLEGWKDNFAQWDENTARQNLNNQFNHWRGQLQNRWLWSGNPFVAAWIESYKLSQSTGDAFIDAITRGNSNQCASFDSLQGYILAYEFLLQDESALVKRRNGEEKAFSRLRNQLAGKKDELIGQVVQFQDEIAEWKKETQGQYEEWFSGQQEDYRSWKQDQNEAYAGDHEQHKSQFDQQMGEWVTRISDLESTYHEKLRLEKPAEYWRLRSEKLHKDGMDYVKALIVFVFIGAGYFSYIFVNWLSGVKTAIDIHGFQGAVLLTVIISSFIFLVRVLSKMAFSAFHLQRDAEEREQLAYVYLALVNEAKIDEESRKIVLQSLFSRAETGLLAGENGPTMPIADLVKATRPGSAG